MALTDDDQTGRLVPMHPAPAETPPAPGVADGAEHRLDPRSVTADRLSTAIACVVMAALGLVAALVLSLAVAETVAGRLAMLLGWAALCVLLAVWCFVWPAVRYRYTFYSVSADGIRIRRGVVWRSVTSVPRNRVQHTDVSQGPVERSFDLATLVIYTAGTHYASVHLGGLEHATAMRIRDHLILGGQDDAV